MARKRANKFKKGKRESIKIKTDNKPRNFESNEIPKKNKGSCFAVFGIVMTQIADFIDIFMGNKISTHQKQHDTTPPRCLEEGSTKKFSSQRGAQCKDTEVDSYPVKDLNIQEVNSYPVKDLGRPKKITATLLLLLLLLFVILLLPPPFWLLLIPPVLILLYLYNSWYKPTSSPSGPTSSPSGPASSPSGPTSSPSGPTSSPYGPTNSPFGPTDDSDSDQPKPDQSEPYPLGPPPVPPRLQNFGNTCFFNAALQGIISTSEFYTLDVMTVHMHRALTGSSLREGTYTKQYVVPSKTCDVPLEITVTSKPGPLTVSLNGLFWKVCENTFLAPRDLLTQLGKRNSQFIRGTQEDSHEALRYIFDALKDEEIQPIKRQINSKKILDGEDKLNMKGYLRMATKILTAISKAIEGKTISVTICHECHEVTENEEAFFDISLPMPEEITFKKKATGTKWNRSQVEMNGSSKNERKKSKEKNNKIFPETSSKLESPTSATLPDKSIKENMANTEDTGSMPSNRKVTNIDTMNRLDGNGNDLTENKTQKVTDIDSMSLDEGEDVNDVKEQQPGDIQGTQMDLHTNTLATKSEDESVSHDAAANLEARNLLLQMVIDKSKSRKDSDLGNSPSDETITSPGVDSTSHGMQSTDGIDSADLPDPPHINPHGANTSAEIANHQNSNLEDTSKNSDEITIEKNMSNSSAIALKETADSSIDNANLNAQQSVQEKSISPFAQHSAFQTTKEVVKQGVHYEDTHGEGLGKCCGNADSVTNDKDAFQQYLIQRGFNHLTEANRKHTADCDLQLSLFIHTDLDVLDVNNKFICHSCSTRNQQNLNDEPELRRVSKQIMIHQLPPVLILHMKRFELGSRITKDTRYVSFPEILNMAPYCTAKCLKDLGDSEDRILYGLYAVVVHCGGTLHGGHYIAYVKTQRPTKEKKTVSVQNERIKQKYDTGYCEKGQWYYTSDTTVRKCSFEDVSRSEAYMLFYERLPLTN